MIISRSVAWTILGEMSVQMTASAERRFAAAYMAVLSFVIMAAIAPELRFAFRGQYCVTCEPHGDRFGAVLGLPPLAAFAAYVWARILYKSDGRAGLGLPRSAGITVLAYVTFAFLLAGYVKVVMPLQPGSQSSLEVTFLLLLAFIYSPLPWLVLILGTFAGWVDLVELRRVVDSALRVASTRAPATTLTVRKKLGTSFPVMQRPSQPSGSVVVKTLGVCGFLSGAIATMLLLDRESSNVPFFAGSEGLTLPLLVALSGGCIGWAGGHYGAARLQAGHRSIGMLFSIVLTLLAVSAFLMKTV